MIKKYNYKIAGIASFAGFAINNVKAATGGISFKIGDKVYAFSSKNVDHNINEVSKLIEGLVSINEEVSLGDLKFNPSTNLKNYFIESITSEAGTNVKLDKTVVTLAENKPVVINLVPKRDYIEFIYTENGKQLTKANEDKLLESVIQGKKIQDIKITDVLKDKTSKLGGKAISGTEVIGVTDLILNENNKLKFEIDSSNIADKAFKTVVCKFAEGVEGKLVKEVDSENLCVKGADLNDKTVTEVLNALNKIKLTTESVDKFFNDSVKSKIKCNGTTVISESAKTTSKDDNFIVINNIVEADINPIFLKKTFEVELDSNEINKTIVDDVKKLVEDKLKEKFEDTVVLDVNGIVDFLKTVKKSVANDIFVDTAFNSLNNVAGIEGVELNDNKFDGNSKVNASAIKIKLKSAAFVATHIKTTIKLTLTNIGNQTRGDKTLKPDVKTAIEKIFNDTKTAISKADFVGKFNDSKSGIQLADANNKFAETDFEFSPNPTGDIDKDTNVTLKKEFWDKLHDSCFEEPKKPKEKEDDQSTSTSTGTGSGDNNGGKDSKKGCCGSNKK